MTNWDDIVKMDGISTDNVVNELQIKDIETDTGLELMFDKKQMEQYDDGVIYHTEKELRKFIARKVKDKKWRSNYRLRRYTMSMLLEEIFGRPYDRKIDGKYTLRYKRVFAWYSSQILTAYTKGDNYKKNKPTYVLSPGRYRKIMPYSLRLRYELLLEQGKIPANNDMRLPIDNLTPGHARCKRTEKNKRERSRAGKERYLQYQKRYRESIKQSE